MTELELDERTNGHAEGIVEVDLDALLERVDFDDTGVPTDTEAAAIVSAIGAHLTDRQRAATRTRDETTETVGPWGFSGRLERVGAAARRRPRHVERGSEWQAAARTP